MTFFPDLQTFVSFGSLSITWYAVFILSGAILAYYCVLRQTRKWGYDDEVLENFFLTMLPLAIIGARIYYVIFEWEQYAANPIRAFYIWEGGLAIHGGVIVGIIYGILYFKKHHMDALRIGDAAFPFVMVAQAIGRWGNFMNQEAYGDIVDASFFQYFPKFISDNMYIDGYYRQPTFLFESIGNLIGFVLIYFVFKKVGAKKRGDVMYAYFAWYGMIRFFIESLRSDSLMLGSFKVAQIVSLALVLIGILGILGLWDKLFKNIYPWRREKPVIIFDVDGTLLNTKGIVYASFKHVFATYKPDYQLSDEELRSFFGPPLVESFGKYFPSEQVDKLVEEYRDYYAIHYQEYVDIIPEVKETLTQLSNEGYRMGVVSNKLKSVIDMGLEVEEINDYFEVVLGCDEIGKAKPSPQGLINACKMMKCGHDQLVYVGDNVVDVQCAKAMSAYSVAYACDEDEANTLKQANPKALIKEMHELIDVVHNNDKFSE